MASCFRASLGAFGLSIFLASGAGAEPSAAELAAARDMFNEARQAEDAGNWTEALRKLRAVADVKLTAQVRFHLGLCEEQLGQLIEALNDFERAKIEAGEQHVTAVAEEAPAHAARVRARLPTLILRMPQDVGNAKISIDDQPISAALAARPVPLNPGEHAVAVSAPGKIFRQTLGFAEKEEKKVDVVFSPAPLELAAKPEPAPSARTASAGGAVAIDAGSAKPSRTLGWTLVGVGGAALVGAGVSTLVRARALSDIDDQCPSHADCPSALRDSQTRAKTFGALALGLGIAGAASVGVGVVLLARPAPAGARAASFVVGPWAMPGGAGAVGKLSW